MKLFLNSEFAHIIRSETWFNNEIWKNAISKQEAPI